MTKSFELLDEDGVQLNPRVYFDGSITSAETPKPWGIGGDMAGSNHSHILAVPEALADQIYEDRYIWDSGRGRRYKVGVPIEMTEDLRHGRLRLKLYVDETA